MQAAIPTKRTWGSVVRKKINRAWSTKSARRTKAAVAEIRDAIIDVIEDDPPMTVRQVFYQLVARGIIEKTEEEYHGRSSA